MRSRAGVLSLLSCGLVIACSGSPPLEMAQSQSALSLAQSAVLGFENVAGWSTAGAALELSTMHTEGGFSLGVRARNYTVVTSIALSTVAAGSPRVALDLMLPVEQPNPWWYGTFDMSISIPSQGIYNAYVGQRQLTGLSLGTFVTVELQLPASVFGKLGAAYSDMTISIVLNVPWNATGLYRLDHLRFGSDTPSPILAATPPMGWNSWNRFNCDVSEQLIKETADAMVASGMKAAGYQYVNIDDCWQTSRDASGTIVADPERFPSGIKALADYVHSKGLKLGIYSDRGTLTCQRRPGSQGYEAADARTYAAWGVDYLKYDSCNADLDAKTQYETMHDAIAATGRPIVFSICAWTTADWMPATGQLWRSTGDISDDFGSVLGILDTNADSAALAGPGHWNDPDMLEVGNGGMTAAEYRAHFSLWAIMAAPLIAGNDLRSMSDETRGILTAPEIIAVDQDSLGAQGVRVRSEAGLDVWSKLLKDPGTRAVALFNRSDAPAEITATWRDLGLRTGTATVRDLWARADRGSYTDRYAAVVPPHDVAVLKIVGSEALPPLGTTYLSDIAWRFGASGWGPAERDMSNGEKAPGDGKTLTVGGAPFAKGVGVHAASRLRVNLAGLCSAFSAQVGLDDEVAEKGSVVFQVLADGTKLYDSGAVTGSMPARSVSVSLAGKNELELVVDSAGDGFDSDHADWAAAQLRCGP